LRVITPAPRDAWLEILASSTSSFVYQTPLGIDSLCAETGWEDVSRFYEFPNGRRIVLPLMRTTLVPHLVAVDGTSAVGSFICRDPVGSDEIRAIVADLASCGPLRVSLRPSPLEAQQWEAAIPDSVSRVRRVSHLLSLEGGFETVWTTRFNGQARRACRKAEKADIEIVHDTEGALVDEFHALYLLSVERWAQSRGEPRALALWRARRRLSLAGLRRKVELLGQQCHIWVARVGGRPAAAIVVLQGTNAHYTLGAMDQDLAGPVRASFMLQKLAIEQACEAGCRHYFMGNTGTSASLARFKEHFGAVACPFFEYRIERLPLTGIVAAARDVAGSILSIARGGRVESASRVK